MFLFFFSPVMLHIMWTHTVTFKAQTILVPSLSGLRSRENTHFEFKMHFTSKGRTKWWLWYGKTAAKILHIISATLWSMYTLDCSSAPRAFVFPSVFLFSTTVEKYFLGTDTRGQNNKHKQGEAEGCWIHFHGTYHHCREACRWCWCKGMYALRRLSRRVFSLLLLLLLCYLSRYITRGNLGIQPHVYIRLNAYTFLIKL